MLLSVTDRRLDGRDGQAGHEGDDADGGEQTHAEWWLSLRQRINGARIPEVSEADWG